ncbi:hypothetical protein EYF80_020930 [Liparis tanakae]|uniref:Uncharacterized protein n=1 Tax=Liparis tanakae TaxID=230148 RepID=A0A4Z2HU97_9TELE|nr:hypothetical protein EYF80_020930 [Liparis tanakae]
MTGSRGPFTKLCQGAPAPQSLQCEMGGGSSHHQVVCLRVAITGISSSLSKEPTDRWSGEAEKRSDSERSEERKKHLEEGRGRLNAGLDKAVKKGDAEERRWADGARSAEPADLLLSSYPAVPVITAEKRFVAEPLRAGAGDLCDLDTAADTC